MQLIELRLPNQMPCMQADIGEPSADVMTKIMIDGEIAL